jgi:hypothetical protein
MTPWTAGWIEDVSLSGHNPSSALRLPRKSSAASVYGRAHAPRSALLGIDTCSTRSTDRTHGPRIAHLLELAGVNVVDKSAHRDGIRPGGWDPRVAQDS